METVMQFLKNYPEIVYGLSVCFLTFVILKYLILEPTRIQKFVVLVSSGVILGVLFYLLLEKLDWTMMVLAFLASIGFYEMTIKIIMRKLHTSYTGKIK